MPADFVRPMGVQPPDDRPIRDDRPLRYRRFAADYARGCVFLEDLDRYGPTEHGIDRFDGGAYVKLADVLRLLEEG